MKILINAQLVPGRGAGGVETVLAALVCALGKLTQEQEFCVVCHPEGRDWLLPFVGPNTKLVVAPVATSARRGVLRRAASLMLGPVKRAFSPPPIEWFFPAVSHGFLESLECDVAHFPYQDYCITSIPSLFSPHDLQHRHFPQFFSAQSLVWREELYRIACRYSKRIVVGSNWVKEDIIGQFGIHPTKIIVIPLAPPSAIHKVPAESIIPAVLSRYGLTRPFILYPSMTWPHKNHIRLIEALASFEGPDLVCTGYKNDHYPKISRIIDMLGLGNRVHFPGFIPGEDLKALYRSCEFVVIPTLFESTSEPIFEAWEAGKAVACSHVTALPEQTNGAALLFDPYSVNAIGQALGRMDREKGNYEKLGVNRLKDFSWDKTARAYRALYREVAGLTLTQPEKELLFFDWRVQEKRNAA